MNSEYVDSQSTAIENIIPSLAVPAPGEEQTPQIEDATAKPAQSAAAQQGENQQQTFNRDAIIVVCLFWMLSSPFIYKQMNQFITVTEVCTDIGPPNGVGLFIHGVLCGLLYYLSQKYLVF